MYNVKWILTGSRYLSRTAATPEKAYDKLSEIEKEIIKNEGVDVKTTKLPC